MINAQILAKSFSDLGVKKVFGYSGGTILPVFHAMAEFDIQIVTGANEQSCAFSAGGYSRSSHHVGVAVVTSGPAITNTLTAVADANADSVPLLIVAGQVARHRMGTDEFQTINVGGIFADAAKKVISVTELMDVEEVIKDAYYLARSGKPGPVVIDFPFDIQTRKGNYRGIDPERFQKKYDEERHLGEDQCRCFFDLLSKSKRPLLYIGGGLNSENGSRAVRAFNRRYKIPSVSSLMGKGVLDEQGDWALGMLGMFGVPAANMAIQETDLFIALGIRWDDRVSQKVGESGLDADIAYFDINPQKVQEVRFAREPKFSFIGRAETALADLLSYAHTHDILLDIDEWQAHARQLKARFQLNFNRGSDLIQQAEVMAQLSDLLTENTKITTGVGNHQMFAAQHLVMPAPKSFLTSGGYGTMGFALPTAIGVQFANPGDPVIAIDGDSSMLMNFGELLTICRYRLPVKILLLNNHGDGMVRNLQNDLYEGNWVGTDKENFVNFARVAKELGFEYHDRVTKRGTLKKSLAAFMAADGPAFLEVATDKDETFYPRIPGGKGYQEMILGPYMEQVRTSG